MKVYDIVYGSSEQAKPLIVGKDTVYVHANIEEITDDEGNTFYRYHEIQYTKDEYIKLLSDRNSELQNEIRMTQIGLMEVAAIVGGE